MAIIITTEPTELIINGTTILMQSDPTASKEWETLLDVSVSWATAEAREQSRTELTEALSALAQTPEDGETLKTLNLGLVTLKRAGEAYVQEVTGFPTKPAANSKKR